MDNNLHLLGWTKLMQQLMCIVKGAGFGQEQLYRREG
jgi:hypothetical protein